MEFEHFENLEQALKTDASILGIALFVFLPLSYVHNLFFVIFTLALIYLAGSCTIYLISVFRQEDTDGNPS